GPPTTEGGARPRPLRGKVVAWSSSSCAHDHDRLCIPPTSPAHKSEAGKKESTDRHLNRRCRPSGTPSSNPSSRQPPRDVRTAEPRSTHSRGVNKSAKVVLSINCAPSIIGRRPAGWRLPPTPAASDAAEPPNRR